MSEAAKKSDKGLDSEKILAYLTDHPEFFVEHPGLLPDIGLGNLDDNTVPFALGKAVVWSQHQTNQKFEQLFKLAKENDRLFKITQELVFVMLEAGHVETLLEALRQKASDDFEIDQTEICLFANDDQPELPAITYLNRQEVANNASVLTRLKTPICGALRSSEISTVFGETKAIKSAVLLPLSYGGNEGLLAFGSDDAHFFVAGQDTLFVELIAGVLARQLVTLKPDA